MFWNNVAGIYDIFVNVRNRKTHLKLKKIVAELIEPKDAHFSLTDHAFRLKPIN